MSFLARGGIILDEANSMKSREEDELVRFLRKRTRRRFTRLVRATRDMVLNAAYRVTADEHLAEDVTQEVFVKLLTVKWDPDRVRRGTGLLVSTTVLTALMRVRGEERHLRREQQAVERRSAQTRTLSADDILHV